MYEICALLAHKRPAKRRAPASKRKPIKVGALCKVHGREAVVTRRDTSRPAPYNAWYVAIDGVEAPYSFSRDMITVL